MTTSIALPRPEEVKLTQVRDVILPRSLELRQEIALTRDITHARECCRQLEAFRKYLQDRQGRDLIAAECRRMEVLIGKLLGPGEVGANQHSKGSPIGEPLPKDDRHKFRLMAAHECLVEEMLEDGIVSRNVILDSLKRRDEVPPDESGYVVERLQTLIEQGKTFGTIYADPPWQYGNQATRASTGNHYRTMTLEEIAALPVKQLAAENAHCHLWTTNAFLPHSFAILQAWSFEYKSCFVWVKSQMGIGNYWRVSHEYMLLGVKGSLPFRSKKLRSWLETARGRHSAKPERVREMVEKASPGPRLELFARMEVSGWTVWGNQVGKVLFSSSTPKQEAS